MTVGFGPPTGMGWYPHDEEPDVQTEFCEVCGGQPAHPTCEGLGYCKTCNDNSVFVSADEYERLHPDEFAFDLHRRLIG